MLESSQRANLRASLIKHEGIRLKSYVDTRGNTTLGVGINVSGVGITFEEAMYLLTNRMDTAEKLAFSAFPWFTNLTPNRQNVVTEMVFNLGLGGLEQFKNLLGLLENANWGKAADEMLNSKWAAEVGQRAIDLSNTMRTG